MENSSSSLPEFLKSKKIDPGAFRVALPTQWLKWERDFSASSQAAFEQQAKFLLNNLRLEFPLAPVPAEVKAAETAPRPRPLMRKPVISSKESPSDETT